MCELRMRKGREALFWNCHPRRLYRQHYIFLFLLVYFRPRVAVEFVPAEGLGWWRGMCRSFEQSQNNVNIKFPVKSPKLTPFLREYFHTDKSYRHVANRWIDSNVFLYHETKLYMGFHMPWYDLHQFSWLNKNESEVGHNWMKACTINPYMRRSLAKWRYFDTGGKRLFLRAHAVVKLKIGLNQPIKSECRHTLKIFSGGYRNIFWRKNIFPKKVCRTMVVWQAPTSDRRIGLLWEKRLAWKLRPGIW
jgi:hypothetical protein